jgi:hypothetical protein
MFGDLSRVLRRFGVNLGHCFWVLEEALGAGG